VAGALFYTLYAYAVYLVGAPFTVLVFAYVALVILSASTLIGIVASIDSAEVRHHLAGTPVRSVGDALIVIAILAYAGPDSCRAQRAHKPCERGRDAWAVGR